MASQLRLHVLVPLAVLGLLGAGVGVFVMSKPPSTSDANAIAARIAAQHHTSTTAPTTTTPSKNKPKPSNSDDHSKPVPAKHQRPANPLAASLRKHSMAVVLFYRPDATYDAILTREARSAAVATGVGFVAINVTKNKQVAKLAAEYSVLEAPTVLIFRRGPKLEARFEGYNDRTTIVQAITNV